MLHRVVAYLRANLLGAIALFVALGGTSYAAVTNVTSSQIKNNTIQGKDIKDGSVKSADVGNGSLLTKDFRSGQLPAGKTGATGGIGPKGDQGPRGLTGPKGDRGIQGIQGIQGQPGKNGTNGTNGTDGRDGTALGYAHVLGNGTLDTARSRNLFVRGHITGEYCLGGNGPLYPKGVDNATASIDVGGADTRDPIGVYLPASAPAEIYCFPGDVVVYTRAWNGGLADKPFYIMVN